MLNRELVQQFECLVIRSNDQVIECEMHDLTETKPVEYAEIYKSFFKNFDSSLLTEGRVFYFNIFENNKEQNKFVENYSYEIKLRD